MCDTSEAFGRNTIAGDNFSISITTTTRDETDRIYEALSEGDLIKMPLSDTFWRFYFGKFTDRFGIYWMASNDMASYYFSNFLIKQKKERFQLKNALFLFHLTIIDHSVNPPSRSYMVLNPFSSNILADLALLPPLAQ